MQLLGRRAAERAGMASLVFLLVLLVVVIEVDLGVTDGLLMLRITDDGIGIGMRDQNGKTEGLGLKIMRYRAQMLGGDLVIESIRESGTSVRCSCPLDFTVGVERGETE